MNSYTYGEINSFQDRGIITKLKPRMGVDIDNRTWYPLAGYGCLGIIRITSVEYGKIIYENSYIEEAFRNITRALTQNETDAIKARGEWHL